MQTPDFVRRTDTGSSHMALRAAAPRVLEVHLLWDQLVLDTQHHRPDGPALHLGEALGWRWKCLGVDMGWIRPELRHLAAVSPPLWSEVEQAPRCDLFAPSELLEGEDRVELVRWEDGEALVSLPKGWTAEIGGHGRPWQFVAEDEIVVPADQLLRVRSGELSVILSRVRAPRALAGRPEIGPDGPFAGVFSMVAVLGLIFGIAVWSQPPTPTNEVVEITDEVMSLVFQAPEPPPPPTPEEPAAPKAAADEEEGKAGKEDGNVAKAKAPPGSEDAEIVQGAGLMAVLDQGILGGGGGIDKGILDSIGGLSGPKGTQIGRGGLGRRGNGPGGGGVEGTHIGGTCIGDIEKCGAAPTGVIGGTGEKPGSAIPSVEDAVLLGNMDRALIDEVIKRHMRAIRYCYQKELQGDADLSGKIVVGFTIAKDGSVSRASAKRSTIGSAAVDSCVVGKFLRMQFPKPKGGGIVIVSYPFLFAPG